MKEIKEAIADFKSSEIKSSSVRVAWWCLSTLSMAGCIFAVRTETNSRRK